MNFYRHIQRAIDHLEFLGIPYEIDRGRPVPDSDIADFEEKLGQGLPMEYKEYLSELGDGFRVYYNTPEAYLDRIIEALGLDLASEAGQRKRASIMDFPYNSWGLDPFDDTTNDWEYRQPDLSEDAIASYLDTDGEEYLNECRRRRQWLPILGVGGGGYTVNYDYGIDFGAIRYHDIRMPGHAASAYVASSLDDWMHKWSQFSFSSPIYQNGGTQAAFFESYCDIIEGKFPWDGDHFLSEFKVKNS